MLVLIARKVLVMEACSSGPEIPDQRQEDIMNNRINRTGGDEAAQRFARECESAERELADKRYRAAMAAAERKVTV